MGTDRRKEYEGRDNSGMKHAERPLLFQIIGSIPRRVRGAPRVHPGSSRPTCARPSIRFVAQSFVPAPSSRVTLRKKRTAKKPTLRKPLSIHLPPSSPSRGRFLVKRGRPDRGAPSPEFLFVRALRAHWIGWSHRTGKHVGPALHEVHLAHRGPEIAFAGRKPAGVCEPCRCGGALAAVLHQRVE